MPLVSVDIQAASQACTDIQYAIAQLREAIKMLGEASNSRRAGEMVERFSNIESEITTIDEIATQEIEGLKRLSSGYLGA